MDDPQDKGLPAAEERDASSTADKSIRAVRRFNDSYGLVFALILLVLLVTAVAGDVEWGGALTVVVLAVTLIVTLRASEVRPRTARIVTILVGIATVLAIVSTASGIEGRGYRLTSLLAAGLVIGAPVAILHRLRRHVEVTMRTVMGALCIYLFIGLFFALAYGGLSSFEDGAFFVQTDEPTQVDFIYFSYVTQATVGYGDLSAATDLGRMLAITEGLLGQIYLVTIVALLVGNLGRERPARRVARDVSRDEGEGGGPGPGAGSEPSGEAPSDRPELADRGG
jgi:hypothetical protein